MGDKGSSAAGVLLGTFAADALGARWEGAAAASLDQAADRLRMSLGAQTLTYTDDTQLTLALAEHLCGHPQVEPDALAQTFLEHFEDWRGYARGMFGIVAAWRAGTPVGEAATAVFPEGSFGNGAAMRAAPVGVVHSRNPGSARRAARAQAAITHAHPVGMDAAAAQAHAVALATAGAFGAAQLSAVTQECRTDALRESLLTAAQQAQRWHDDPQPTPAEVAGVIGTDVLAHHSVAAALWVATVAADFEEAVLLSLALGGDVDTVAAMAGAVVGAALTETAIPARWLQRLEDGPRGRTYAQNLALRLTGGASPTPD